MTVRTQLWRRVPLALAFLTITIAAGAGRLSPSLHRSPLQTLAMTAHATPSSSKATTSTTVAPSTTTTAAPAPESVEEVAAAPEDAGAPAPAPTDPAPPARATRPPASAPPPEPQVAAAPPPAPKPPPARAESEAAQFFSLLNQFRAEHGLPALVRASDATAKAQQHSDDMAASQQMYHSSSMGSGLEGGYEHIGENVAMGPSVGRIEPALESSAGHRRNMLNPNFNQVGIGVSRGDDGMLYVTEVFLGR